MITNPFWPDRELCERNMRPDWILENQCQVLDLPAIMNARGDFERSNAKLRYNLRRAQSGVLEVDEVQSLDNLNVWYPIHLRRHEELGIPPLPYATFEAALLDIVPRDLARFVYARLAESGEMVGGALFIQHAQVMDMLIASGQSQYAKHRSS